MIALASIVVLWIPSIFAPIIIDLFYHIFPHSYGRQFSNSGQPGMKSVVLILLCLSIVPLRRLLRFEHAQRRVIRMKKKRYKLDLETVSRSSVGNFGVTEMRDS